MAKYSRKVVIVGAGVAGVTSAAWLSHNGVRDVIVLEAQDYVGGRVKGEIIDGKNIDFGAQFVHGREQNPAFQIAQKLGIVAYDEDDYQSSRLHDVPREFTTSKGNKVPGKKVLHFLQFLYDELNCHFNKPLKDDSTSDGDNFVKAYTKFLDLHRESLSSEDVQLYDAVYRWHKAYHKLDNAIADPEDLSAWGASKYIVFKGEEYTNTHGGMVAILKSIADLVPREIIHLNTPVMKIDWSSVQQQPSADSKVVVTCTNGDVIEAEHVIVTISAGCMQAYHKDIFFPSLPGPFQSALQHIGFGAIGKIFIKWEKPFWNNHGTSYFESFEFLWLDSHPISIASDRCQKKTRFGKPWWYDIQSVETVLDHPNILEVWLNLDQIEVVEQLDDDEVMDVCHELLQKFLKEYENIPKPVQIYKTNWMSNPYIRGTYSYPKTGIREEDLINLGAPLPSSENPRVLFAGEAYSLDFISTFHGSLLSGLNRADQILSCHGIRTSKKLIDLIGLPTN